MANVQLQRPLTTTTTAIAQKQSQEVVQTIVHGGLSSLSYLREFFPEKAFVKRVYGEADDIPDYDDYAVGRLPIRKRSIGTSTEGMNMQLLQRGKSRRVDTLLDWLEDGAFPAIKSGNLRALQVFVHADPEDRKQVIESYTFTIKYIRDAENQRVPSGIEVGSADGEPVTVGATSRAMQGLVLQINQLCENLPQLPRERYISMALAYSEDHGIPTGWTAATSDKLLLGEKKGWIRHDGTFDNVGSRFHETTFAISYLQGATALDPTIIPEQLTYTREHAMLVGGDADVADNTGQEETEAAIMNNISDVFAETQLPEQATGGSTALEQESVPTQSLAQRPDDSVVADATWKADIASHQPSVPTGVTDHNSTQSSTTMEMREAFVAMMQPEQVTQGDTQTQASFGARHAASETTASPSRGEPSPLARKKNAAPKGSPKLALSQTTVARLEREKAKRRATAKTKSKGKKRKSLDIVTCQCGSVEEDGGIICCNICDTWQHLTCYGFEGQNDDRLPHEHVCYQCLLGNDEPQTLDSLRELTRKRQIMAFILHEGPKLPNEIAQSLQLKVSDTKAIVNELHREGYIIAANRTTRASSSQMAFIAVKSGPKHEKMQRDLFDPLLLISHHYQVPNPGDEPSFGKHLADASAIQMPPPTTPASWLVKLAETPGSGRDLPDAMTNHETPSKLRGRPSSGSKRRRVDPVAGASDEGRAKSVETQYLLDAGGLSSPATPVNR